MDIKDSIDKTVLEEIEHIVKRNRRNYFSNTIINKIENETELDYKEYMSVLRILDNITSFIFVATAYLKTTKTKFVEETLKFGTLYDMEKKVRDVLKELYL